MTKKKMTLDRLAGIMQNQFSKSNKKIDKVDGKVDDLKYDFDHLKMKVDDIDHKLDDALGKQDNQDTQLKSHKERIIILEKKDKIKA